MQRFLKMISVVCIAALTLAAVAESSAQYIGDLSDKDLCQSALNRERDAWGRGPNFANYVAEATKRGLTVDGCRHPLPDRLLCGSALAYGQSGWDETRPWLVKEATRRGFTVDGCSKMLAEAESDEERSASAKGGTTDQRAFLEAALFFLTGVDPTNDEIVSNREIVMREYPLVAYLVDDNPCAVRLRNTTSHQIWQMDFCKLTRYQFSGGLWHWEGKPDAFCVSSWVSNENYADPDLTKTGAPVMCGASMDYPVYLKMETTVAFSGLWDINQFTGKGYKDMRSQQRLIASFKYIQTLLSGKPY